MTRLSGGRLDGRTFQTEHPGNNLLCLLKSFWGKRPQTTLDTMPLNGTKAGQIDHTWLGKPGRLRKWDFAFTAADFAGQWSDHGNGSLAVRVGAQNQTGPDFCYHP